MDEAVLACTRRLSLRPCHIATASCHAYLYHTNKQMLGCSCAVIVISRLISCQTAKLCTCQQLHPTNRSRPRVPTGSAYLAEPIALLASALQSTMDPSVVPKVSTYCYCERASAYAEDKLTCATAHAKSGARQLHICGTAADMS